MGLYFNLVTNAHISTVCMHLLEVVNYWWHSTYRFLYPS